jgi:hypothetical protein
MLREAGPLPASLGEGALPATLSSLFISYYERPQNDAERTELKLETGN